MDSLTSLTPTNSWTKAAQVIVDWSDMPTDQAENARMEMDHLMQWICSYPQRSLVQVVLRRSRFFQRDRVLQNKLQSLGCTVALRSQQTLPR